MKISVCVITYNSSSTVVETLNSIKNQSFDLKNVELVVSDDCSTDKTKEIVEQWVVENGSLFFNVVINCSKSNQGVSHNCNLAMENSQFDWIKIIAGDDILLKSCLEDNANYVKSNKDAKVVFSKMRYFNSKSTCIQETPLPYQKSFYQKTAKRQLNSLLLNSFNMAPTAFINKEFIISTFGGFDENYRLIEDLPMWIKVTESGCKLSYFDKVTVCYRVGDSITRDSGSLFNIDFFKYMNSLFDKEIYPRLSFPSRIYLRYDRSVEYIFMVLATKAFNSTSKQAMVYRTSCIFRPRYIINGLLKYLSKVRRGYE
ncbi:glycosyltransferase family 2 protein [Vibrio alginolyticus]|uniref:glycosyltransferase family 2 protein n=1 Tax=Vibrio alginolyticus TaxID=663 RepID=UPI0021CE953A